MSDFLTEQLQKMLPSTIGACVSTSPPPFDCELPAAEEQATKSMQPGRRKEFAHGRLCAREALERLGEQVDAVPVGEHREPVWPEHIVGSISHCGDLAGAIVAHRFYFGGLGIDFEPRVPLHAETLSMICTPGETEWLDATAEDQRLMNAKLLFSAKESVYKCIWPSIRRFVDFSEITVEIEPGAGKFRAKPNHNGLPPGIFAELNGRFYLYKGWIMTIASLPPQG